MSDEIFNTGQDGERVAATYLLERGYTILERNKRICRVEIDIIAERENIVIFVEVKTRKSEQFGTGMESVNLQKQKKLAYAASLFLSGRRKDQACRFDVISIQLNRDATVKQIVHIQDAFRP